MPNKYVDFTIPNVPNVYYLYGDFLTDASPFSGNTSGGGSAATTSGVAGHPGIMTLSTAAGVAASASVRTFQTALMPGTAYLDFRVCANLPVASGVVETYIARSGFMPVNAGATAPTDGIFFRYTDAVNGGRWECVCRVGGVETATDSGVAPNFGAYDNLEILVNNAATSCAFYINDVLKATVTTNIPVGVGVGANTHIAKTLGVTPTLYLVDYMSLRGIFTTRR